VLRGRIVFLVKIQLVIFVYVATADVAAASVKGVTLDSVRRCTG